MRASESGSRPAASRSPAAAAELAPENSLEKASIYNTLATIYKITKKNSEAVAYYKKILDMKSLSNYGLYKSAKSEHNRLSKSK